MSIELENPWRRLPLRAPFVLPEDRQAIRHYNRGAAAEFKVQTRVLPEPFVGRLEAQVVLLNLNPGFESENLRVHKRPSFVRSLRRTLRGSPQRYPFYYLDPREDGGGHRWWRSRLAAVTRAASAEITAQELLCVEYFPYHSRKFNHAALSLPSQEFGFALVRSALRRRAVVIVMRGRRLWERAVPELLNYRWVHVLNSPQNVSITPRNCPTGFPAIIRRLRRLRVAR